GLLFTVFMWWRDVIKEAHGGDHTPVVQLHLRYGMILFIASEVMFFVAWFWAYFDAALYPAAIHPIDVVTPDGAVEATKEVVGTLLVSLCRFRALAGDFTPKQHFGFEAAAWYWHFVDVVCLFLFMCIYVWGAWVPAPH